MRCRDVFWAQIRDKLRVVVDNNRCRAIHKRQKSMQKARNRERASTVVVESGRVGEAEVLADNQQYRPNCLDPLDAHRFVGAQGRALPELKLDESSFGPSVSSAYLGSGGHQVQGAKHVQDCGMLVMTILDVKTSG